MNRIGKRILIIGIALLCVLVAVLGVRVIYIRSTPIWQLEQALGEGEYKTVRALYEENNSDSDFKERADSILSDFINNTYEKYLNLEEPFDDAEASLRAMKFYGKEPTTLIKQMRAINKSRAAYENAEQEFLSGDYEKAIKSYRSVIEEDSQNYAMAQQKIEDCISAIRNQAKEKATALKEADNGKEAVLFISKLSKEYVDDELLKIKADAIKQLEAKANAFESEGNYAEAISLLTDKKGNPIDNSVSAKVRSYKKEINIKELKSLKQYINVEYDSVEKDYTVRPRNAGSTFPTSNRSIYPMIMVDSSVNFSIVFGFINRDWVFTDSIIIDCGEKQFTFPVEYSSSKRDVFFGGISEKMAYVHDKSNGSMHKHFRNLETMVKSMGEAEKITVRFKGSEGHKDVTIPPAHIEQICNLWEVYKILEEDRTLISQLT